ncbi:hypothetical protein QTH97_12205 [Variovorax sp. J22R24]|uniref:hypothetical protein n=1 Tax=Variovorax gracilis TaxID=3053502 RepID=UPI0025769B09|nr:hypothetical protein [Variovorax sp. J22R24]MDM0105702.1 hypothetical protein [Variovorax sp. J22R24]
MSTIARFCGLACTIVALPAWAQSSDLGPAWDFEVTPYFWATAVRADVDTRFIGTQRLHVPFSDLASALDFGAMGAIEARKGRWGGLMDVQYVKLGTSKTPFFAPLTNLDIDYEQQIWTMVGFYRVMEGPALVDVVGGARYLYTKTEASLTSIFAPIGPHHERSQGWWDGVVGARVLYPIDGKWSLLAYADVGAGGSDLSWQALAGASYRFSEKTTVKFGYRYFSFDRDDAPVTKASLGGPYVGVGFKF